jgi:hypothetical protein
VVRDGGCVNGGAVVAALVVLNEVELFKLVYDGEVAN